ncbi:MAG: hypothetical protein J0L88_12935 [Xanthomonadales bacterium]|nr:hypothetical protein [Xanthomonadales bacterium]
MNLSVEHRELLRRGMPLLLAGIGAWLLLRALKRSFWVVFGLAWAFWWVPAQAFRPLLKMIAGAS